MTDRDADDLQLHQEISAKERLDALLEAPQLSHSAAVAGMDALYRENQATFPHVVIATVMARKSLTSDERAPHLSYVGPFRDRRAAEMWATSTWADIEAVTWEVARLDTPERFEETSQRIRDIVNRDEQ